MKANAPLYVAIVVLLMISIVFFILGSSARKLDLTTDNDRISYRLGLEIAQSFGSRNLDVNAAMLMRGLNDGRYGQRILLSDEQINQEATIVMSIMKERLAH